METHKVLPKNGVDSPDQRYRRNLSQGQKTAAEAIELMIFCNKSYSLRKNRIRISKVTYEIQTETATIAETWLAEDNHIPQRVYELFDLYRQDNGRMNLWGSVVLFIKESLMRRKSQIKAKCYSEQFCTVTYCSCQCVQSAIFRERRRILVNSDYEQV